MKRLGKQAIAMVVSAQMVVVGCMEGGGPETGELVAEVYTPPAEGAAFGIPGTAPATTPQALMSTAAAGKLSGSGSVGKDGNYKYRIPIATLPGRAGMEPTVALAYDSRGGDGLMGMGWTVAAGQSVISRCNKISAAGFRESANTVRGSGVEPVMFQTRDVLCLDGQRLDLVAGTYGKGNSEYRTEVDTFAKVVGSGQSGCTDCEHASFKVFHRSGEIGTYVKHAGGSSTGYQRHGATVGTLTWVLSKVEDRSGNAVEYVWTKENATAAGEVQSLPRLTEVRYTTCTAGGANTCPYGTAAARKVTFGYEVRPDARVAYLAGARIDARHRLTTINVFGDAAATSATWTYTVGYKRSDFTGRSLVTSVQQCAGSDCLPATTFRWQEAEKTTWYSTGLVHTANYVAPGQTGVVGNEPNASEMSFVLFDGNGDGHLDIVYKDWPATAIDATTLRLKRTSDTMGAGPHDVLAMGQGGSGFQAGMVVDLENDGQPQASVRCVTSPAPSVLQGEIADLSSVVPVDMDQDGREELWAPLNKGCPFQWVSTTGGVSTGVRMTPALRLAPRVAATAEQRVYQVLNVDRTTGKLTKRTTPLPFANSGSWDQWKYNFIDFDGNGVKDIYYGATNLLSDAVLMRFGRTTVAAGSTQPEANEPEVNYPSFQVGETGYDTQLRFSWQPMDATVRQPNVLRVQDENGDGREEIRQIVYDGTERGFAVEGVSAVRTFKDTAGGGWREVQRLDGTSPPPAHTWPAYPTTGQFVAGAMPWRYLDVNGDGLADALYARKNNTTNKHEWFYRLNTGLPGYLAEVAVGHIDTLTSYGALAQPVNTNGVYSLIQDIGLRFADMNGDGRDDLVLLDSATGSIMYSTGTGFEAPVNLPARASGTIERIKLAGNTFMWPATQLADVDGDGLTDVVEWVRDMAAPGKRRLVVLSHHLMPHNAYDVILEVRDGLDTAAAEQVGYGKLAGWHQSDATPRFNAQNVRISPPCRYPARCVSRGLAVARYQTFRSGRMEDRRFDYAGARFDVQGRGWLGFREVKIVDKVAGTTTTQVFDQRRVEALFEAHWYPGTEVPASTVVRPTSVVVDGSLTPLNTSDTWTQMTTTFTPTYNNAIPLRATQTISESTASDLTVSTSGATATDRMRQRTTTTFDAFGSPTSVLTRQTDLRRGSCCGG